MTLASALEEFGGVNASLLKDKTKLLEIAASNGNKVTPTLRLGKIIAKLFDVLVEPKLIQPTFITGYPVEVSPLSRRSDTEPDLADRFELRAVALTRGRAGAVLVVVGAQGWLERGIDILSL